MSNSILGKDVDEIAAGTSPQEEYAIAAAFHARATSAERGDPWHLLGNVFEIHLNPENPDEPFQPMWVVDGKRSMVPSDLSDGEVELLKELLNDTTAPVVRARIGDVLWVARRDGKAGQTAVPAYLSLGTALEDPDMWPPCMECYERAIRLARSLGRSNPLLTAALQHLLDRVTHYEGGDPSFFTSRALVLLDEFRFGDPVLLSGFALTAAYKRKQAGDPYSVRAYFDIAARLLNRAGLLEKAEQARIESAQSWTAEADQAEAMGNHAVAQSHLESAIQAFRIIPSQKGRLPALHHRLDAAGAKTLKSMRPIGKSIDIGPLVDEARQSVRGLPLAESIWTLAYIAPPLNPLHIREHVLDAAKKAPLASMLNVAVFDRNGRIIHKHPGLYTSDPEAREQAIDALICRHADILRGLTVKAQIAPALMEMLGEHSVEDTEIFALLKGSTLVPEDRAGLFALGLAAGFRRDIITAIHLLVPQLEHALRVLLRSAGVITASIDQDGIQADWPLGRLLGVEEIRQVLPETLIFEMRSLLVYKGSSNIRNRLCHGLMAPDDFASANALYLWWLLLKVALHGTLGFQAWISERMRGHNETREPESDHLSDRGGAASSSAHRAL